MLDIKLYPMLGTSPSFSTRGENLRCLVAVVGGCLLCCGSVDRCGFFFTDILLQCLLTSISLTGGDLKDKSTVRR